MIKTLTLIVCVVKVVITMNAKCDPIIGSVFSYAYTRGCCYFVIDDPRYRDVAKQLCQTLYPGSQLAVLPDDGLLQTEIRSQMTATIPITETEIAARWGDDHSHDVNDNFLIARIDQYGLGDDMDNTFARVPMCQKRMTSNINYSSLSGVTGTGALLGSGMTLRNEMICLARCSQSFACLSFSWLSTSSTCQLHYVTTLDSKLTVTSTGNTGDKFYEIVD